MAKNCNTPVDYWLSLSLRNLAIWIRDNNDLIDEEQCRRKKK